MNAVGQKQAENSERKTSGTSTKLGSGHLFLAVLCMLSVCCNGQTPMLCQTHGKGQIFSLPEVLKCQINVSSPLTTPKQVTYELARRNLLEYETQGYLCRATNSSARLLRYFFGDETLKEFQESPIPITVELCKHMVESKASPAGPLFTTESGLMKTNNQLNWRVPNWGLPECCKWWTYQASNYFVIPVSVYSHFGAKQFQCTGADVTKCPPYSFSECQLGNQALVWEVDESVNCEYLPYQNISGHLVENSWLSLDGQLALTSHNAKN